MSSVNCVHLLLEVLVVGESPLVLLYSVVMSYVNCGDDG